MKVVRARLAKVRCWDKKLSHTHTHRLPALGVGKTSAIIGWRAVGSFGTYLTSSSLYVRSAGKLASAHLHQIDHTHTGTGDWSSHQYILVIKERPRSTKFMCDLINPCCIFHSCLGPNQPGPWQAVGCTRCIAITVLRSQVLEQLLRR